MKNFKRAANGMYLFRGYLLDIYLQNKRIVVHKEYVNEDNEKELKELIADFNEHKLELEEMDSTLNEYYFIGDMTIGKYGELFAPLRKA